MANSFVTWLNLVIFLAAKTKIFSSTIVFHQCKSTGTRRSFISSAVPETVRAIPYFTTNGRIL